MPPRIKSALRVLGLVLLLGLLSSGRALADGNWIGTGTNASWSTIGNWSGNAVPGNATGGTAVFTSAVGTNGSTVTLGNNGIAFLSFNAGAAAFTFTSGTLAFGQSNYGITLDSTNANNETFDSTTTLVLGIPAGGADTENFINQNTASEGQLIINGAITGVSGVSGATTLNLAGTGSGQLNGSISNGGSNGEVMALQVNGGTWRLSGSNTYTGPTTFTGAGTIIVTNTDALEDSPVTLSSNGTLDLASDINGATFTSASFTIAANSTIGVGDLVSGSNETLNLGAVSIGADTLGVTSTNGYTLGLGSVTITGNNPVFSPGAGSLTIGSISGAYPFTLGGTGLGAVTGIIANGSHGVTVSGGTWTLSSTNSTYTGLTTVTSGTLAFGASTVTTSGVITSGPIGTGTLALQGGSIEAVGGPRTIANNIGVLNDNAGTIAGNQNLTLSGTLDLDSIAAHWTTLTVNNSGVTTFSNAINYDNQRLFLQGSGAIVVTGSIFGGGSSPLTYQGTGSLDLAGVNTYNVGTTANLGTIILDASTNPNASIGTGAVNVGNTTISTTSGNATLLVKGNYLIGNSGTPTVTITGGNGTTTGQGALSLVDGSVNTLTIQTTNAPNGTILTLGANSILDMEVGAASDEIILGSSNQEVSIGGTVLVNITGLGGLSGSTQNLLVTSNPAPFTVGAGNNFLLNSTSGNFGGYTVALSGSATGYLQLTENLTYATPSTAYWNGGINGTWNTFTGGNANSTNWVSAGASGTDTHQSPGAATNVYFSAAGGGSNLFTTLGANTTINSLTFTSDASVAHQVTIGGANTLTLAASGANGITVNPSSGAQTITSKVALGSTQTWSINNSPSNPLTVSGVISDGGHGFGLLIGGAGTLVLGAVETYTGATNVSNGTLLVNGALNAASAVTVSAAADNTTVVLGGTGTINGTVTISAPSGSGRLDEITGGNIGAIGTLTLDDGLSIGNGGIAYFDISSTTSGDFLEIASGGLNVSGGGAIVRVPSALVSGTYGLIGNTGLVSLGGDFTLEYQNGLAAGSNYTLALNSGTLDLVISAAALANPTLTLNGGRFMKNTGITLSGVVGNNSGGAALNGTLANNGGSLAVSSFNPGNPVVVASGTSAGYTATIASTGASLGNQTVNVIVSDSNADPTSATASATVTVVDNRVVTASPVTFGPVHIGAVSSSTVLTSTGLDSQYTRVTVANGGPDSNGISVSGGNPATIFNGSTSDTRTVSGALSTLGLVNGAITLVTGSEGLAGESPINVTVSYSAQVFSGKAAWTGSGGGTSWAANSNWGDTQAGDLGGRGAPGVSGTLSTGDTATFGDVPGESATTTVTLDGANPSLAALTLSGTGTSYTIATGSGGTITLQGSATPISVTGTHAISAVLGGGGLLKTGTGVLMLAGANTYTGATVIANGILQLVTGNNILPVGTNLTLGDGAANTSGELVIGDTNPYLQTVASISVAGTGTANRVAGNASGISTLAVNNPATDTYAGILGGPGANQNNLALVKENNGTLILSGDNTYTGGTTLDGGILNLGSAGALGTGGTITFNGGALQFSSANNNDYSSRFAANGNAAYILDTNGVNVTLASPLLQAGLAAGLTKNGLGALTLASGNTYTGATIINAGVLATPDLTTYSVQLQNTGVWEPLLTGSTLYTPTIGQTGPGALYVWTGGGFAAKGAKLTVDVNGGAALNWGTGNFMAAGTAPMVMGALTANNLVEFQNSFDFGAALPGQLSAGFNRVIDVEGAAPILTATGAFGITGNAALLSGVITANVAVSGSTNIVGDLGDNGFVKTGGGTLILSNSNTYSGTTTVSNGTLIAGNNALLGVPGAFGDGHTQTNSTTGAGVAGNQLINLGDFNINGNDGTTATGASPTVLIGGPFTVQAPINIQNFATTGTYTIGGSTDNASTFSGPITFSQSFAVTQVANSGNNGSLNIAGDMISAANLNTVKTVTFANAGAVNVSGNIASNAANGGTVNVTQAGSGVTTISSTVGYTGTTSVTGGTLVVSGGLSGASVVNVGAGAELNVDGTINTSANIAVSGTLSGAGTVGNVAIQNGGTIAPGPNIGGVGIGTFNANNIQLQGGGVFKLKLDDDGSTGTAGTDWDQLYFNELDLSSATLATTPFVLSLQTLDGNGNDNPLAAFNPTQSHTWVSILNFLTINGTFSPADFTVNTANFLNATNGGTFSVVLDTGNEPDYETLDLVFTPVPEPGIWSMALGGVGMLLGIRRLRGRQ